MGRQDQRQDQSQWQLDEQCKDTEKEGIDHRPVKNSILKHFYVIIKTHKNPFSDTIPVQHTVIKRKQYRCNQQAPK